MNVTSANKNDFYLRAILSERANYIVSKMASGSDYSAALLDAQQNWNGDTTRDYEGRDTVGKLSALVEHCCGLKILPQEIFCRGIAFLNPVDFEMADHFGYAIKYLGIIKCVHEASFVTPGNCQLDVRMHAALISSTNPLSLVNGAQQAVEWGTTGHDGHCGQNGLIAQNTEVSLKALPRFETQGKLAIANILDLNAQYYIRFTIQDSLEAVAAITKVLSNCNVGLQHLLKQGKQSGSIIPLVAVTHETNEKNVRTALKEIDGMGFITQMTKMIRVDE